MKFEFTANYNEDFSRYIDELFTQAKALNTDRETRLRHSDELVESYVAYSGERPQGGALARLATLILRDELIDPRKNKSQLEEFPIMSDNQYRRRVKGEHQRLDGAGHGEVSFNAASVIGIDGRNHGYPTRRHKE